MVFKNKFFMIAALVLLTIIFLLSTNYVRIIEVNRNIEVKSCNCTSEAQQLSLAVNGITIDNNFIPEEIERLPNLTLLDIISKTNISRKNYLTASTSILAAYKYSNEVAVQLLSMNMFKKTIYCHYYDENGANIGEPFKSFVFPESVIYCAKRPHAEFISISEESNGKREPPVRFIDRTNPVAKHFFTVCLAPIYGNEPKWLWLAEFIEHYKIQGATHFFVYITDDLAPYDRLLLDDYVRTGDIEVIPIIDRFRRSTNEWQTLQIHDCLLRSRFYGNWSAFVDIDERMLVDESKGTLAQFLRNISAHDPRIGSLTFRQRWILKDEYLPSRYEGTEQVRAWMPTQRYHNASAPTPPGWVVKTIIQPHKVLYMWVHVPIRMYEGYHGFWLNPQDGLSRHYRNKLKYALINLPKFGNFSMTNYPEKYNKQLVEAVTKRLQYVYEYETEESNRTPRYQTNYQNTLPPKIIV